MLGHGPNSHIVKVHDVFKKKFLLYSGADSQANYVLCKKLKSNLYQNIKFHDPRALTV